MSDTLGAEYLETLRRLEDALKDVEHVLIGGQAVFFSGYPRFTEDVDIGVIVPVKQAASRLVQAGFKVVQGARFVDPSTKVQVDVVKLPRCTIPYVKQPVHVQAATGLTLPVLPLPALV